MNDMRGNLREIDWSLVLQIAMRMPSFKLNFDLADVLCVPFAAQLDFDVDGLAVGHSLENVIAALGKHTFNRESRHTTEHLLARQRRHVIKCQLMRLVLAILVVHKDPNYHGNQDKQ